MIQRAVDLYGQGTRRLLVPLATGLGKTVIFTHLPQVRRALLAEGTIVLRISFEGSVCAVFLLRWLVHSIGEDCIPTVFG